MKNTNEIKLLLDPSEYSVYDYIGDSALVALKMEEVHKVNLLKEMYRSFENIPIGETVNGKVLHYNKSKDAYCLMDEVMHELIVKDLSERYGRITYDQYNDD